MRGAVIGFGNVAAHGHMPGWQSRSDVSIVAATDTATARRTAFLAACPDGHWYDTLDDLLSRERLDFVDICTPPASHVALIARALDAGLHVLCEKPLVVRAADASEIARTAKRSGRVVQTVHNWLEAPVCRRISALIAEGAIGAVHSVGWHTLRARPAVGADGRETWRLSTPTAGGGILFDHGWHALYCAMSWFGGPPRAVAASLENRTWPGPPEDTASLTLEFASGEARIFLTWAANERTNHIDVRGECGSIRVRADSIVLQGPSGEHRGPCPPALSDGSYHPDWFGGAAAGFCAAMTHSGTSNLTEAVLCAQLIDLARRSSEAGGAVLPLHT